MTTTDDDDSDGRRSIQTAAELNICPIQPDHGARGAACSSFDLRASSARECIRRSPYEWNIARIRIRRSVRFPPWQTRALPEHIMHIYRRRRRCALSVPSHGHLETPQQIVDHRRVRGTAPPSSDISEREEF